MKVDPLSLGETLLLLHHRNGVLHTGMGPCLAHRDPEPIGWYLVEQVCVGDLPRAATSQLISANRVAEGLLATGYC
jgi:hypothetical protein